MSYTNRVAWETLRTLDSATMVDPLIFYNVGGPLLFPSYKLKMVNVSNVLVRVSTDGLSYIDVAPANSFWLYDETQASIATANCPAVTAGTQISVSSSAAGVGSIYLVSQYLIQA